MHAPSGTDNKRSLIWSPRDCLLYFRTFQGTVPDKIIPQSLALIDILAGRKRNATHFDVCLNALYTGRVRQAFKVGDEVTLETQMGRLEAIHNGFEKQERRS